jgi:hypothetical protein
MKKINTDYIKHDLKIALRLLTVEMAVDLSDEDSFALVAAAHQRIETLLSNIEKQEKSIALSPE